MSEPTIPVPPAVPTQPEPKRKRAWLLPTAVGVGAFLLGVGVGVVGGGGAEPDATTSADRIVATETAAPAYTPPPAPAEPTYPDPVPADFTVTLYETEKQCFGSAGCNVTFTVDLAYAGPLLDPAKTYELRYEVSGAEDPLLSTLEIHGEDYTSSEDFVSTASESDELTATVLDIRER